MTPRERLMAAFRNEQPDRVPCSPDLYEMVPQRLSGRPAWESLVYADPPMWKLRMDACAHYGIDAVVFYDVTLPSNIKTAVVSRTEDRVITRNFTDNGGAPEWWLDATVIPREGPSAAVRTRDVGLPLVHDEYEVVEPVYRKMGREAFEEACAYVGERGVLAPMVSIPALRLREEEMIEYYEDPDTVAERIDLYGGYTMSFAEEILSWKPDVLVIGNSGLMISNPPNIFRHLSLKWLQKVTELAAQHGVVSHIHCCGPERTLLEIAAGESSLCSVEPLETAPMGDCDLKEIKRTFGKRFALKGNLHTTEVMLLGTPEQVREASKRAIDDAGEGGGFILSTGDQTPRDTPDENIYAMLEAAETHGRY